MQTEHAATPSFFGAAISPHPHLQHRHSVYHPAAVASSSSSPVIVVAASDDNFGFSSPSSPRTLVERRRMLFPTMMTPPPSSSAFSSSSSSPMPPSASTHRAESVVADLFTALFSAPTTTTAAPPNGWSEPSLLSGNNTSSSSSSSSLLLPTSTGGGGGACVDLNELLWETRHDPTTRPAVAALFAVFYALIISLGVVGNVGVLLAIARTRSLQTVPNMFILSLSCSDIVVSVTSATITPITAFKKEWLFGVTLCSVSQLIAGMSLCFSTFTLAAISIDRFLLIRFPTRRQLTHTQTLMVIGAICVLAGSFSVPAALAQTLKPVGDFCGEFCYEDWGTWGDDAKDGSGGLRRAYGSMMLVVQFLIPLTVITLCYSAISIRLGQSIILRRKKEQQKGCGGKKNKKGHDEPQWQLPITDQQRNATKRRQRTNRMFIAMVVAFSLSWVWSVMFNLGRDFDILPAFVKQQEFLVGIATHCIAMTSTVWNPILYALLNLQLRAAFLQLLPESVKSCFKVAAIEPDLNSSRHPPYTQNGGCYSGGACSSPYISLRPAPRTEHSFVNGTTTIGNGVASTGIPTTGGTPPSSASSSNASCLRTTLVEAKRRRRRLFIPFGGNHKHQQQPQLQQSGAAANGRPATARRTKAATFRAGGGGGGSIRSIVFARGGGGGGGFSSNDDDDSLMNGRCGGVGSGGCLSASATPPARSIRAAIGVFARGERSPLLAASQSLDAFHQQQQQQQRQKTNAATADEGMLPRQQRTPTPSADDEQRAQQKCRNAILNGGTPREFGGAQDQQQQQQLQRHPSPKMGVNKQPHRSNRIHFQFEKSNSEWCFGEPALAWAMFRTQQQQQQNVVEEGESEGEQLRHAPPPPSLNPHNHKNDLNKPPPSSGDKNNNNLPDENLLSSAKKSADVDEMLKKIDKNVENDEEEYKL